MGRPLRPVPGAPGRIAALHLPLDLSLVAPGDRVLIGVSGGADSLSLLHALSLGPAAPDLTVIAAHVHHGMRGEAADADAAFLHETCAGWNIALSVAWADVPALARERRISIEEAGRVARLEAFAHLAARHGCDKVATAHTADDQAETLLLHLLRGSGLDGLCGMPARRPLAPAAGAPELIRPLLPARRADTEAYCAAYGLSPRLDITNQDLRYRRNRLRHEVLPLLDAIAPGVCERLVRLSYLLADERDYLRARAEELLACARVPNCDGGGVRGLQVAVLQNAPAALARRALRDALREMGITAPSFECVERLRRLLRETRPAAFTLPGGSLRATCRDGHLEFAPITPPDRPSPPPTIPVSCPGVTNAPAFALSLELRELPSPPETRRCPPAQALFDRRALHLPLLLRPPGRGDRFRPFGAPGRRLLSDVFADRKVPVSHRGSWPILADQEGIVWVVGLAAAERTRVSEATIHCVQADAAGGAANAGRSPIEAG